MAAKGEGIESLRDFLADAFNASELGMFLSLKGYQQVADAVNPNAGTIEYSFNVVQELGRRGLIDAAFFERLRQGRPGKKVQIEALQESWLAEVRDVDFTQLKKVVQHKYLLIGVLGKGHGSLVTLAFDKQLQRRVTIKSLTDVEEAATFDEAVRRAAKISLHPNIMSIYGAWLGRVPHHYVREYVEGHSLRVVLEGRGQSPLPVDFVQRVFSAVGDAVAFAEQRDVTDLDIKPENIIVQRLTSRPNPGLSSNYMIKLSPEIGDRAMLRKLGSGAIGATIVYFPPDLFNLENIFTDDDHDKMNQYRLGILGYEMLSTRERFQREAERRTTILLGSPSPWKSGSFPTWPLVETMRPEGCPRFLSLAINRMIAPDPEDRFPALSDAVAAIAGHNLGIEVARESYRRILSDHDKETEFFRTFYLRFLDQCSAAAKIFEDSGFPSRSALESDDTRTHGGRWPEQFTLLKEAIVLLFAFNILNEDQEPTILDRIARKHMHYPPSYYDSFARALVQTVLEFDKDNYPNELKKAWENAVMPGINYMKRFRESHSR